VITGTGERWQAEGMPAPLGFAHRGARADAPENTLRAFRLALDLGAEGIETDVWLTADGVAALHHGPKVRLRRGGLAVPIGQVPAARLPAHVPTLEQLYAECGTDLDLSLDLKDGLSAEAVLQVARAAGHDRSRLWLCARGAAPLSWRGLDPDVRLVSDTRHVHVRERGWPDFLAEVRAGGGAAVNLRRRRWSKALVDLVHDNGLLAFGWDAQTARRITALLALGCDAVYSDHVRRMVPALQAATSSR
jgi:glycerophosphoryl diester phosphodiesterase